MFVSSLLIPPGVVDNYGTDDDDDMATEVQTNFCCLTKLYDALENSSSIPPLLVILITTNHTKFGTHHYMLVLLLLIEDNAKRTISNYCLACEIFLLLYLFPSSRVKARGNFLFLGKLASLLA